jgi:hypothetical protein
MNLTSDQLADFLHRHARAERRHRGDGALELPLQQPRAVPVITVAANMRAGDRA